MRPAKRYTCIPIDCAFVAGVKGWSSPLVVDRDRSSQVFSIASGLEHLCWHILATRRCLPLEEYVLAVLLTILYALHVECDAVFDRAMYHRVCCSRLFP